MDDQLERVRRLHSIFGSPETNMGRVSSSFQLIIRVLRIGEKGPEGLAKERLGWTFVVQKGSRRATFLRVAETKARNQSAKKETSKIRQGLTIMKSKVAISALAASDVRRPPRGRTLRSIGWAIYAAGFVIWLFGYLSAGHAPVFDWAVATPWRISSFVPNLEAELGLALMFASMVPIYWPAGRKRA